MRGIFLLQISILTIFEEKQYIFSSFSVIWLNKQTCQLFHKQHMFISNNGMIEDFSDDKTKLNTGYVAVVFLPSFRYDPLPSPCAWFPCLCAYSVCVFSSVMAQKHIVVQQCDQLFDRWYVLTPKLADIGWWLRLDSHRKLAICCNMPHRLRQGASVFKGIEWQDETFIKGLSICSYHIIFTLFQGLMRAATDKRLF